MAEVLDEEVALHRWPDHGGAEGERCRDEAFVESFNGRMRDECLNLHWLRSLRHARDEIAEWRHDYNAKRPHSALGWLSPMEVPTTTTTPVLEPLTGSAPARTATTQLEISSFVRP